MSWNLRISLSHLRIRDIRVHHTAMSRGVRKCHGTNPVPAVVKFTTKKRECRPRAIDSVVTGSNVQPSYFTCDGRPGVHVRKVAAWIISPIYHNMAQVGSFFTVVWLVTIKLILLHHVEQFSTRSMAVFNGKIRVKNDVPVSNPTRPH